VLAGVEDWSFQACGCGCGDGEADGCCAVVSVDAVPVEVRVDRSVPAGTPYA
jgi:hypothetical protein